MLALLKLNFQLSPSEYLKIPGRMDILASDPRFPILLVMDDSQIVMDDSQLVSIRDKK